MDTLCKLCKFSSELHDTSILSPSKEGERPRHLAYLAGFELPLSETLTSGTCVIT